MRTKLALLLIQYFIFYHFISGQSVPPKYEFRAVWVATVANIDWPSKPGLGTLQQQDEVIKILEMHRSNGMNAIILQIRPAADAFYPSDFEPWSRYLSGTPGKAPDPYYDPLQFWIDECHKRSMELHAWMNPYRVANRFDEPLAGNHIAFRHPEWILKYGEKLYFDPGIPETREFVTKVVTDVVSRYDVDAIHFDDYFYPYQLPEPFPDTVSFSKYSRGFSVEDKADWRRENVDILIKMLNDSIKAVKPWVKFGISPFGVWRNKADDPKGSETKAGTSNYDGLFADILKWLEMGWIDYVLPQLYWQIGHPTAEFVTLANWWSKNTYGKGLYIGQAVYRIDRNSTTKEWTEPDQLPRQLEILRGIPEIKGSTYFSSKHFNRDLLGFQDSLRNHFYRFPAIVPTMPWLDSQIPAPVKSIRKSGKTVKWETDRFEPETDKPWNYIIYMNEQGNGFNLADPRFISVILNGNKLKFQVFNRKKKRYEIRVSVLDRCNNESDLSKPVTIKL